MTAPAPAPYTTQAATAILEAARAEHDFAGWLAAILAAVMACLDEGASLTDGRPGSWEAALVGQLVDGTAGAADLAGYAAWAGLRPQFPAAAEAGLPAAGQEPAALTAGQLATIGQALADATSWCQDGDDCAECEREYGGLCETHATRLLRVNEYQALGRALGIGAS